MLLNTLWVAVVTVLPVVYWYGISISSDPIASTNHMILSINESTRLSHVMLIISSTIASMSSIIHMLSNKFIYLLNIHYFFSFFYGLFL